jgi:hypothetical protein
MVVQVGLLVLSEVETMTKNPEYEAYGQFCKGIAERGEPNSICLAIKPVSGNSEFHSIHVCCYQKGHPGRHRCSGERETKCNYRWN